MDEFESSEDLVDEELDVGLYDLLVALDDAFEVGFHQLAEDVAKT